MTPQRRKRSRINPSNGEASRKKRRYSHRGRTVLDMAVKALKEKKPIKLEWDKEDYLPTGKYASKFSSWIGVTVRGNVSCALNKWEEVDQPTLDLMLSELTGAFNVIEERHDWCLHKLANLWRKWKCTLVREWMYDETGVIQMTPPPLYKQITQEEWNKFVASHSTERFKAISKKNKENAAKRRGTYYGSRAGYRGIQVKVKNDLAAKGKQVEKVGRYLTWLRGHKSDKGDMTDYVKEVASKIEALEKDVEAGVFVPEGREDILARAIGKPEHPGRVRGVSQGICITEYFGKGPRKPTREELYEKINCMQEKINDIEKMKAMMMHFWQTGERPSPVVLDDLMKGGVSMSTEGSKNSASTHGSHSQSQQLNGQPSLQVSEEPPRDETPREEVYHTPKTIIPKIPGPPPQQGSHSQSQQLNGQPSIQVSEEPPREEVYRTPKTIIPKILGPAPQQGSHSQSQQLNGQPSIQVSEEPPREEVYRTPKTIIPKILGPAPQQAWKACLLSLPRKSAKIVASGMVYLSSKSEFVSVHGIALRDGFRKVSIMEVYSGSENVDLPVPIDDAMTLIQAKGSFVQWPQTDIHSPDNKVINMKKNHQEEKALATKSKPQKHSPLNRPNTFLGIKVSREFKPKQRTIDLKLLETEARVLKASGTMINVEIDEHILHNEQICNLSYEELVHLLDEDEIGTSHITLFLRYLSDVSENMRSTSSYGFLCPHTLSPYSTARDENYRSDYIAKAMTCTGCGRGRKLIFAPYVEGGHWMLRAINPAESIVYWCDPAGYEEPRQFFVDTITKAFDKRNSIDPLARYEAKDLVWKKIKCPTQPFGIVLYGYYICRYMLEIVRGRYVSIIPNFMLKAPKTYTVQQIDEVRDIWGNFALQFKPKISEDEV